MKRKHLFKVACIAMAILSTSCSTSAHTPPEQAAGPNDISTARISVDEGGPRTLEGLVDESTVIVRAVLKSIVDNAGLSEGPNEDEPTAQYVELIGLDFSTSKAIKGDTPSEFRIPWYGYLRENLDGLPGDRIARIELQGVTFGKAEVGNEYILFLAQEDGKLDAFSINNSLVSVTGNDKIIAVASGGFVGMNGQNHTVQDIENLVNFVDTSEDAS